MINLINLIQTPVQTGIEASSDSRSLFLFCGIIVVCIVLFIYFLRRTNRLIDSETDNLQPDISTPIKTKDLTGEEATAIALAIHMYQSQLHDMESLTITLQKVSRIYSPWSSKIYSMRQNPRS
jgi:hypothetical protein